MAPQVNPYQDFHRECVDSSRTWQSEAPANLQWLSDERQQGLSCFEKVNWPTRKTESWKYSPITPFVQGNLLNVEHRPEKATGQRLDGDHYHVDIVNGHVFADDLVKDDAFDIIPFSTDATVNQALIKKYLNKAFKLSDHPFAIWNASILQDGLLIRIHSDKQPARPICINHISNAHKQNSSSHTRVLIVSEAGSKATVIENYRSTETSFKTMANVLNEVYLAENSHLTHLAVNGEDSHHLHTGAVFVEQQSGSQFIQHNFATGSHLKRRDIQVKLLGPQADCKLYGAYVIGGKDHVDYHTTLDHVAPHCTSEETFKGIITDQGKAVFNGRIHIHPDAQQSDAQLNNQNLLLTNTAEVNTKPELEIYADDVKCAHGATVGQLDENALYYFQTRGISKAAANKMLSHAFVDIIINEIKVGAVRQYVTALTDDFLASDTTR